MREPASDGEHSVALSDAGSPLPGEELSLELGGGARTWVDLNALTVRTSGDAGAAPNEPWDIAFEGWELYTNSGPSGRGDGAAFGPLDELSFLFDTVPEVPFLREDATGGAFLNWYAYDGSAHQLWSRYHVFGVRRGERFYKVQILGYYGEAAGAPVSALYRLRYAAVSKDGVEDTVEITDLDATAGYPDIDDEAASGCVNLQTGERLPLTPEQARQSTEWDLCFRRDAVSVNGEEGGPGEVAAVDLEATDSAELEAIQERTAASTLDAFDAVRFEDLTNAALKYRGDHVVSAFEGLWVEDPGKDAEPGSSVWLVRGGDGASHALFTVTDVEGDNAAATRVVLRVKNLASP